uniref:Uncharacterized protein n=1 Tax=Brassica oleracea var. oleracea TaxID=109376 RepID=A0A0D3A582_BRAOL
MEVRSETTHARSDKLSPPKLRLQVWFAAGELWHPRILTGLTNHTSKFSSPMEPVPLPPPLPPTSQKLYQQRLLNLTLGAPELDKTYFWANPRRLPKRFSTKYGYQMFQMPHVTWSDDNYYLKQVIQCDHFLQEIPQNSSCLRSAETKSRNGAS